MPLTILAPFCTILAGVWHFPKLALILPLIKTKVALALWCDAAISDLGKGIGKVCSVGDPVVTGWGCKHRNCDTSAIYARLLARPSLRVVGNQRYPKDFELKPIASVGGKRWALMYPGICLSWAHSSAANLSMPKSTQEVRAKFIHVQASQARSLGICAGYGMHCSKLELLTLHYVFPTFPSTHRTNSNPRAPLEPEK